MGGEAAHLAALRQLLLPLCTAEGQQHSGAIGKNPAEAKKREIHTYKLQYNTK
ncbi:MAG: hypothetical protein RR263_03175 [Oscillospiraceae bacterium]